MTTLATALKVLRPELHDAVRRIARKAYGLQISSSWYALRTVAGSAAKWRRVGDSPWLTVTAGEELEAVRCNVPLWASKLGGYGLLPRGVAYPKGSDGQPLQLVAQVNFGELWADAAARDGDFEVPALLPSRGVLAFYADPFDDLYGSTFTLNDNEGHSVRFFDEELRPLEALLEEYRGGAITSEVLESRVGELLWTREEQYDVFETYGKSNPDAYEVGFHVVTEDDVKDDVEQKRLQELGRQLMWEFPEEGEAPPKGIDPCSVANRPKLWCGNVACIDRERAITVEDVATVVPVRSVEVSSMLMEAIKFNPSLAKEEWMIEAVDNSGDVESLVLEECKSDPYDFLSSDVPASYLLGYPDFTQEDPRPSADLSAMLTALKEGKGMEEAEAAALAPLKETVGGKYILLWQFESSGEEMMWGDAGVCNLFIDPADLAARRFDRVWYNWDCC
ncbi:Domain of unknown function (DUF1963), putative [Angomonas deanei]|uniref:DUF1963 domain-containing protein n=1 Tax=Angomonas deanei TaxID=59799 RepID=A0A7G2CBU8_9TRYP|nr:Domain of unknown function (DUF1963), putative [Angomonas deanei]